MKFWLLELGERWDYDDVISCVVRAASEEEARETVATWAETPIPDYEGDTMPSAPGGNDAASVARLYRDPEHSSCIEIPVAGSATLVHFHRRHG